MAIKKNKLYVSGKRDVVNALSGLSDKLKKKILRGSINEAMQPMVKATKNLLEPHKRSGLLRKSISKKVKTYPNGVVLGMVGPDRDTIGEYKGAKAWPNKYAHLVEYGTKPHQQKKANRLHKGSKASRYLQRAWETAKGNVVDIILKRTIVELEKEVAKGRG